MYKYKGYCLEQDVKAAGEHFWNVLREDMKCKDIYCLSANEIMGILESIIKDHSGNEYELSELHKIEKEKPIEEMTLEEKIEELMRLYQELADLTGMNFRKYGKLIKPRDSKE